MLDDIRFFEQACVTVAALIVALGAHILLKRHAFVLADHRQLAIQDWAVLLNLSVKLVLGLHILNLVQI